MDRNSTIDISKGIGILLMMIGHCTELPGICYNIIYSFHMPLFFIFSGAFFRKEDNRILLRKLANKLVKPYIIVGLISIALCFILYDNSLAIRRIQGFLLGNGSPLKIAFLNESCGLIGPIWFLLALFWCRIIANLLPTNGSNNLIIAAIISLGAICIGRYVTLLPFGILEGFSALIFYSIGQQFGDFQSSNFLKKTSIILSITAIWIGCCLFSSLRMSEFFYHIYPLDIIGALGGTYVIYFISKYLCHFKIGNILTFFGRNSLTILCIHQVMLNVTPALKCNEWLAIFINITVCLAIATLNNYFITRKRTVRI